MSEPTTTVAKKTRKWPYFVAAAIGGVILIGSCSAHGTTGVQSTSPVPMPPTAAAQPVPANPIPAPAVVPQAQAPATVVGDGQYEVGPDLVPGKYHTKGESAWGYVQITNTQTGDTIDTVFVSGPQYVTAKKGQTLKFQGGNEWSLQGVAK